MSDVWILGLNLMLIGLLTVFLVLGLLVVVIIMLKHFFGEKESTAGKGYCQLLLE